MKKNILTLHPKQYFVHQSGLKLENVGKYIIEFELPWNVKIKPMSEPEIKEIKIMKRDNDSKVTV